MNNMKNENIIKIISDRSWGEEDCRTPVDGLTFFRREKVSLPKSCLIEPSIVVVVQGKKTILVGDEIYIYDPTRFLITSLDLPASSGVDEASPEEPCLGLTLRLDMRLLTELMTQTEVSESGNRMPAKSIGIGRVESGLVSALYRLIALFDEPETIPVLAPLIIKEIHYRLLNSDQGYLLRQIASVDSQGYRISRAIQWLKHNFNKPLKIEELANLVKMSVPTFHLHFRKLTEMSPLQYQKWLRLNEARRLMLSENIDSASAGFKVGYESPSQFSREYSRLFGVPPKKDIAQLRDKIDVIH